MATKSARTTFSEEEEAILIDYFEANPFLWNKRLPMYRDILEKKRVRLRLLPYLREGRNDDEVVHKWRSLNDYFKAELRKEKRGQSQGSGTDRYTSKWRHIDRMRFLVMSKPRPSVDNIQTQDSKSSQDFETKVEVQERGQDIPSNDKSAEGSGEIQEEHHLSPSVVNRKWNGNAKRKLTEDQLLTQAVQLLSRSQVRRGKTSASYHFSKHVACAMEGLPPVKRAQLEIDILQLIMKYKYEHPTQPNCSHAVNPNQRAHQHFPVPNACYPPCTSISSQVPNPSLGCWQTPLYNNNAPAMPFYPPPLPPSSSQHPVLPPPHNSPSRSQPSTPNSEFSLPYSSDESSP